MTGRPPRDTAGTGGKAPPVPIHSLRLEGVAAPVLLPEDPDLVERLRQCVRGWPSRLLRFDTGHADEPPLCVIEARGAGRYRAHSRYLEDSLDDLPAATAICAVLADLSQAYCDTHAGHVFGLHCGGVSIGSRGVILAGERRAGKSTLVARLSAESGIDVLCDDVLPVAADGTMVGLGLAPRLRLPLPDAASAGFRAHVGRWLGPADDRYGYLPSPALAAHGRRARAEAFVLLDRRPDAPAAMHALPGDELLRSLVERSITAPDGPDAVFAAARALAASLVGLRLVYSDLEEAVELLLAAFPADRTAVADAVPLSAPLPSRPPAAEELAETTLSPSDRCRRAPGTATRRIGGAAFLWRPDDAMLWHLNPVAHAIWRLLARPATARTLAGDLHGVFPNEPLQRLLDDTTRLLARLTDAGFVTVTR